MTECVVAAKSAGRLSGAAELSLVLVSLQLNRQSVAMTTHELSSNTDGRGTSTVARTGGGTALGAIDLRTGTLHYLLCARSADVLKEREQQRELPSH
ncbi:hypothetical protein [Terriglobus aquaticus]|uniref:hypothetical protein n=1 Tax=Terriglobus aquaticus TaxID=940139 RepID=UPI0021DF97B3|nr:hypothetical protein [Terriglobus aquaticus]